MTKAYLTLNGHRYYYSDIKADPAEGLNTYEKATLRFCHQWLAGHMVFTVPTSGSTGAPKLIEITRKQMTASARMTARALGLGHGDHALVCMNTGYIGGKMMLVRGLEIGMDLTVITPSSNPLEDIPLDSAFSFTALAPLQLQTILAQAPGKLDLLNRMKAIIVGGAPVTPKLQQELQQLTCPVYATYGMTETVSHIALRRLNKGAWDRYRAFDEVSIGQDNRGCLTICSVLTGHKTLVTNDLVTIEGPREFEWRGRIDHVVNSGGMKFQVEQIETAIAPLFDRRKTRFFIAGIKDEELGEKIVLIMEGERQAEFEERVRRLVGSHVHKYAVPKAFYYLPRLTETESGKINRRENLSKIHLT